MAAQAVRQVSRERAPSGLWLQSSQGRRARVMARLGEHGEAKRSEETGELGLLL